MAFRSRSSKISAQLQKDMQVRPIPGIANKIGLKDDIHSATAQSAACVMDLSSSIGSTAR
jgi:hypothetical protein